MVFLLRFLLLFEPVLFQARQWRNTRISCMAFTAAFLVVQVHAALGAQTAAIAAADGLHGQCQKNLLGQDIGQKHSFAFKKRDFRVVQLQAFLFFLCHRQDWLIEEVKFAGDVLVNRLQAARAHHFQPCVQFAGYADLPFHEFGRGTHLKRLRLPEVARTVINRARGIALPDANLVDCQFFDV